MVIIIYTLVQPSTPFGIAPSKCAELFPSYTNLTIVLLLSDGRTQDHGQDDTLSYLATVLAVLVLIVQSQS